jgi:Cytochrome oxidase complex assembly protein 1
MSTERPFGDPTSIHRENASDVGKGFAFGCGGCLAVMAIVVVIILGVGAIGLKMFRGSGPCVAALSAAKASDEMREKLGEPLELGWVITGTINSINGNGKANMNILIEGPKGKASVRVIGTSLDSVWSYEQMTASIGKTGEKINLLPFVDAPAP